MIVIIIIYKAGKNGVNNDNSILKPKETLKHICLRVFSLKINRPENTNKH